MSAEQTTPRVERRRISLRTLSIFLSLLVLPGIVIFRLHTLIDPRFPLLYFLCVYALTYVTYARDKKKAQTEKWRIPESTLHLLELLGGWPAAYIAQRKLRHKISKTRYQAVFWTIVFLYQYATLDFLLGWKITRSTATYFQGQFTHIFQQFG